MKRKYAIGAAAILILVGALVILSRGGAVPSGQPPLESLTPRNINDIQNQFNASPGDVRILLLLSPT